MQVSDHITICPLLNQERGLEPYAQPSVIFSATPTGTVQVRIYDMSVQPMVELTSTALSGAELTNPTLAGLSNNYVLDMGHANVTAVVDIMNREAFEGLVMFEDSGGTGEKIYVRISANTAEHVAELFPDNAVYIVATSSNTGTTFPNGSIFKPCSLFADACSLVTSRKAQILDIEGTFTSSSGDEPTNAKFGQSMHAKTIRCRAGKKTLFQPNTDGISLESTLLLGADLNFDLRTSGGGRLNDSYVAKNCKASGILGSNSIAAVSRPRFFNCSYDLGLFPNYYDIELHDCHFLGNTMIAGAGFASTSTQEPPIRMFRCSGFIRFVNSGTKHFSIEDCKGNAQIVLMASTNGGNFLVTGNYDSIQDLGTNNVLTERQLATSAQVAAAGGGGGTDWTTTEKEQIRQRLSLDGTQTDPTTAAGDFETLLTNVDATVSSRSTFNAASDTVTVGTNNDKTGYAMAGTLQSLDALDTAQDTQHAQTQADIAALSIPTAAQNADAVWDEAYAAHTSAGSFGKLMDTLRKANFLIEGTVNGTPTASAFDTTLTEVTGAHDSQIILFTSGTLLGESRPIDTYNNTNGRIILQETLTAAPSAADEFVILPHHVHSISEIQAGLATSAALAVVDSNVDALLVRLGANDTAIIKGLLLGNYKLDGGSGNAAAVYDSNGCMTAGRIRVFASSSAASSATAGAANGADSEIARVDLTASPVAGEAYPATVQGLLT